ncbi:MAG: DUF4440 domain-containing protein [Legionellaceae bacterium]|nr:DUF4440 domain-containing protein [Legionellaceae bacterium]
MFEAVEKLEVQLLLNDMRKDESFLDSVLSEDFIEYGQSGKVYSKKDVIEHLKTESIHRSLEATNLKTRVLAEDIFQVTYVSIIDTNSKALRSSIWKRFESGWKMVFHQGTPLKN